jgi:TonB family protein
LECIQRCSKEGQSAFKLPLIKADLLIRLPMSFALGGLVFSLMFTQIGDWTRGVANAYAEPLQNPSSAQKNSSSNNVDLAKRAQEIERIEAQVNKNWDAYQKLPRRKFTGAGTQEYRFVKYIEDWRVKVERVGNLNYPEEVRLNKIHGSLMLSVSINADGSLENITVSKSSGQPVLDAAAIRIVKLAAPFEPLPPEISKDTDILTISRTWKFTDKLDKWQELIQQY